MVTGMEFSDEQGKSMTKLELLLKVKKSMLEAPKTGEHELRKEIFEALMKEIERVFGQ